jgi:hypothetical protein
MSTVARPVATRGLSTVCVTPPRRTTPARRVGGRRGARYAVYAAVGAEGGSPTLQTNAAVEEQRRTSRSLLLPTQLPLHAKRVLCTGEWVNASGFPASQRMWLTDTPVL